MADRSSAAPRFGGGHGASQCRGSGHRLAFLHIHHACQSLFWALQAVEPHLQIAGHSTLAYPTRTNALDRVSEDHICKLKHDGGGRNRMGGRGTALRQCWPEKQQLQGLHSLRAAPTRGMVLWSGAQGAAAAARSNATGGSGDRGSRAAAAGAARGGADGPHAAAQLTGGVWAGGVGALL